MKKHVSPVLLAAVLMLAPLGAAVQSPASTWGQRVAAPPPGDPAAPDGDGPAAAIDARMQSAGRLRAVLTEVRSAGTSGDVAQLVVDRLVSTVIALVKSALALGVRVLGLELGFRLY